MEFGKRNCIWCGNEFVPEEMESEHCSVKCFHADEEEYIKQLNINRERGVVKIIRLNAFRA